MFNYLKIPFKLLKKVVSLDSYKICFCNALLIVRIGLIFLFVFVIWTFYTTENVKVERFSNLKFPLLLSKLTLNSITVTNPNVLNFSTDMSRKPY